MSEILHNFGHLLSAICLGMIFYVFYTVAVWVFGVIYSTVTCVYYFAKSYPGTLSILLSKKFWKDAIDQLKQNNK